MKTFSAVMILLLCNMLLAQTYQVAITKESGCTKVSNPEYPKEGKYELVIKELFALGKDDNNSKYIFAKPFEISLDKDNNIYILDWQSKIFVFTKDGKYISQFGRNGQGPGDFSVPCYFAINKSNQIVLLDTRNYRMCRLDLKGSYIDGILIKKLYSNLYADSKDNYYLENSDYDESKVSSSSRDVQIIKTISKTNFKTKKVIPIKEFYGEINRIMQKDKKIRTEGPFNEFVWKISPNDFIITGFVDNYEFNKYNLDGKLIQEFNRKYSPIINRDYKEGSLESRYLPVFTRYCLFDENKNFWVNLNKEGSAYIYDVFSEDGIYQKQVYSEYRLHLLKNGLAYSIVQNKNATMYVKVFKYSLKRIP